MGKIVVDSSVWIDFFNKKTSPQIEIVKNLIIAEPVATSITLMPIILQEVLQGIPNNRHYEIVKENLQGFNRFIYDPYVFAIIAVLKTAYPYCTTTGILTT